MAGTSRVGSRFASLRRRLLRLGWHLNGYDRSLRRLCFKHLAPDGGLLVDLGGGSGRFTSWFAPFVQQALIVDAWVSGYEERIHAARHLQKRYPNTALVRAHAEATGLASASVDYVFCTQLLEHVPDPAAVIRETGRILRPGGRAVVITQDGDWLARYDFPVRRWLRPIYRPTFERHPELNTYYYRGWEAWEREVGHLHRFPTSYFCREGRAAGLRTELRHLRKRMGSCLLELEFCFAEQPVGFLLTNLMSALVHPLEDRLPGKGFDVVVCYEKP